jgi:hypothetical protein
MRHLAHRAHMRRWFYTMFMALSSAGLGARHNASRDATHGFVRTRVRIHATRLDSVTWFWWDVGDSLGSCSARPCGFCGCASARGGR